jgi:hypothetical protein
LGEGEQPSAVTGNYKRLAERNSQTHRVQTDRWTVWAGFHWAVINLPHTCLVSRRLQRGRARWRHTLDQLSKQTPRAHKCSAPDGPGDWPWYSGD